MRTKGPAHSLVIPLTETGSNRVDFFARLERVQREARELGRSASPLTHLTQLLRDPPSSEEMAALVSAARIQAPGDSNKALLLFLSSLTDRPELLGELLEAFFRALYLREDAPPTAAPLTMRQAARNLAQAELPGGGFADDLEKIIMSQQRIGPGPWES